MSFVKMFRVQEKAWPSLLIAHLQNRLLGKGDDSKCLLIAHLQNHLPGKRDVSECLRKHTMRSGLSSLLTRQVTLAWTLKFAVLLWNDWTGGQLSVIGSVLSCVESVREVHSVLPFDFPVKSGSWIYFINVGIHLLMCSGKLFCVLDFGDFCSWEHNFGVGMYVFARCSVCVCV